MKILFTLIILTFSTLCYSDDESVYFGLLSHHFDDYCDRCENNEWNEVHDLIAYTNDDYMLGYMTNSFNRSSLYFGKRWWYDMNSHVRPFLSVGLATGYQDTMGIDIGPFTTTGFMGVELHTKSKNFGVIISGIPGEVVAIGLKFGL